MELKPEEITKIIRSQIKNYENKIEVSETGVVILVGDGIAKASGLEKCMAGELVDLPNFNALCAAYGMQVADGMIADTSQGYQNNPYLFFAQADTSVDAASSLTSDSMVLFYASRGFTLADPTRDTITVQPFLTTTENGYAVLDADNMTQGTYVVGAVATEEISEDTTARLTVYGADTLINTDVTNSFTTVSYTHLTLPTT